MAISGFRNLTEEEMEGITGGGFSCPKSQADFQKKLNTLTYNQQKAYIQYCYKNNCSRYF